MDSPYIGAIVLFAGNFAPRGWALCQGQILAISTNTALFSILGTTYGGNGTSTFGLPDLRGRVPVGQGQGPGLSPYFLGEQTGVEQVTLLSTQMPTHNHLVNVGTAQATTPGPTGMFLTPANANYQGDGVTVNTYGPTSAANVTLNPLSISNAGGNQPHVNVQPSLCLNYIIALEGIFPSRN